MPAAPSKGSLPALLPQVLHVLLELLKLKLLRL
jgi:hypothetical protein